MSIDFTEASSLATIDRQIESERNELSPAQYEIIRQVIYHTANFEYHSLLKFSEDALVQGYYALKSGLPVVIDVPEIQVNIVPKLQQTFQNPVYCCATTGIQVDESKTKAAFGLETLAGKFANGIFIIGQDRFALNTLIKLIKNKTVNPSLAIATAPSVLEKDGEEYLKYASIPTIYLERPQGDATVASTIFSTLVNLALRVNNYQSSDN